MPTSITTDMADETVSVLETVVGGPAHLVGWSDGGIIGLLVALRRPDLVRKLVVVGANYHFEGTVPAELDPDSPVQDELGNAYVARSPDGPAHLEVVMNKSFRMFRSEPTLTTADIARISRAGAAWLWATTTSWRCPTRCPCTRPSPRASWRWFPAPPTGFRWNSRRPSTASSSPF